MQRKKVIASGIPLLFKACSYDCEHDCLPRLPFATSKGISWRFVRLVWPFRPENRIEFV